MRMLQVVLGSLWIVVALNVRSAAVMAGERAQTGDLALPNVLWISCEDMSPLAGCYGDPIARTPNIDRLAAEGIRFTHAFSCHGVCAPSRTGIITGISPISLGANHMRSKVHLPDFIRLFPGYMRDAGYYCTNNSKTDYNLVWDQSEVWNESSGKADWKNRSSSSQPFFAVINLTMTHESKIWKSGWQEVVQRLPAEKLTRPSDIVVPPLYPDTPEVRADFARLYDIIGVMDVRVGEIMEELRSSGELENTFVFFWSDHGNGLPRAKRWLYDSGTRVPLIVRVPEKWRTSRDQTGVIDDRLVSLLDLGPTVLRLAGLSIPAQMQGLDLLNVDGPDARNFIHGARDRIDERFDLVRSVRSQRYRYVRNFMPWRPALQHKSYAERNSTRQEMRRLLAAGELSPEIAQYFQMPRPAEELYDLEQDPWELRNLAAEPTLAEQLNTLRDECDRWQVEMRDAHLIPEAILNAEEKQFGNRWQILHGENGRQRTEFLLTLAKSVSLLSADCETLCRSAMNSQDPAARWWAVMGFRRLSSNEQGGRQQQSGRLPDNGAQYMETLKAALDDTSSVVRIAAASGLNPRSAADPGYEVLLSSLKSPDVFDRHAAMIEIDELELVLIRSLREVIRAMPEDEYTDRLADHALGRLNSADSR